MELYTGGSYTTLSTAAYNGIGERLSLTTYALGVPLTTTYTTAEGQLLVTAVGTQTTLSLYGQTQIAEYSSEWSYPLRDSTSSVRQITNQSGAVTLARSYKPFGAILAESGPYETAFGFLGAQLDQVSGLMYIGGRYYDPYLNQFISPDPIIPDYFHPQSLNQYSYTLNNPINYTDPSGYCILCDWIIKTYEKARSKVRTLSGLDDRIDQSSPQIPFSNAAEATLLSLLGEDKAYLSGNAIAKIRQDPEMQAFERSILTDLRSDPRYRHEAFHKIYQPLNDLGDVRSLTFGGFGHPDPMIPDQLFHFYDPKYKPTWDAAKNDLTWLIRHASVKAVGNAAKQGHILIRYRLKDTLDLIVHENEAWNSPYNLVVRPLGFGYHTVLRGTAMEIEGYWSVRIKAVPPLYPCLLP